MIDLSDDSLIPYPLTIILDRYHGTYSGGKWLALNVDAMDTPGPIGCSDSEESDFWDIDPESKQIGRGNTITEAVIDLYERIEKLKAEIKQELKC